MKEVNIPQEDVKLKSKHRIPTITAYSGFGKTRQLLEIRSIVEKLNLDNNSFHFEFIFTTYNSNIGFSPQIEIGLTEPYLALRLLYSYFLPVSGILNNFYGLRDWKTFRSLFDDEFQIQKLNMKPVLELIEKDIRQRFSLSPDKTVVLILGIDEFQILEKNKELYDLVTALTPHILDSNPYFKVIPIFAGLFSKELRNALSKSSIDMEPVLLPSINYDDLIEIVRRKTKDLTKMNKFIRSYTFKYKVWSFGGVLKKLVDFASNINMDLRETIQCTKPMSFDVCMNYLVYTLFPDLADQNGLLISDLENYGCIQILDKYDDTTASRICLPFVVLFDSYVKESSRLSSRSNYSDSTLLSSIEIFLNKNIPDSSGTEGQVDKNIDWAYWEALGAYEMSLRLNVFKHHYKEEFISLKDLLYGCTFPIQQHGNLRLNIGQYAKEVVHVEEFNFLLSNDSKELLNLELTTDINDSLDWTLGEYIQICARDQLAVDFFSVFRDCNDPTQRNAAPFDVLFFDQRKYSQNKYNYSIYKADLEYCRKILNQYREKTKREARIVFGVANPLKETSRDLINKLRNRNAMSDEYYFCMGRREALRHYPMFEAHPLFSRSLSDEA